MRIRQTEINIDWFTGNWTPVKSKIFQSLLNYIALIFISSCQHLTQARYFHDVVGPTAVTREAHILIPVTWDMLHDGTLLALKTEDGPQARM